MKLDITVHGKAEPAGSKRQVPVRRKVDGQWVPTGKTLVIDANPKSRGWKDRVAGVAGEVMAGKELLYGPIRLDVTFYRVRPKGHYGTHGLLPSAPDYPITIPDRTKLLRGLEDALTGIVWRDDAQVCAGETKKLWGEPARVEISVELLPPLREHAAAPGQLDLSLSAP